MGILAQRPTGPTAPPASTSEPQSPPNRDPETPGCSRLPAARSLPEGAPGERGHGAGRTASTRTDRPAVGAPATTRGPVGRPAEHASATRQGHPQGGALLELGVRQRDRGAEGQHFRGARLGPGDARSAPPWRPPRGQHRVPGRRGSGSPHPSASVSSTTAPAPLRPARRGPDATGQARGGRAPGPSGGPSGGPSALCRVPSSKRHVSAPGTPTPPHRGESAAPASDVPCDT